MSDDKVKDVAIIGGGPAGMSAAIWCAELGLNVTLFEGNNSLGGQLFQIYNPVSNFPGADLSSASSIREAFYRQLEHPRIDIVSGSEVTETDFDRKTILTSNGCVLKARAIVLATGVSRRKLNVPGEDRFHGKGQLHSGSAERNSVSGKHVLIVGGGDAAIENALILADHASFVTVIHRRDEFSARTEFIDGLRQRNNIELITNSTVIEFAGTESLSHVMVKHAHEAEPRRLNADFVLIRIGVSPNTSLTKGQIDLDAGGYVKISADCSTNKADVFAVGDVTNSRSPTIASAVGHGATAAKNILLSLKSA